MQTIHVRVTLGATSLITDIYHENYKRNEHLLGVFYSSIVLFLLLPFDAIGIL